MLRSVLSAAILTLATTNIAVAEILADYGSRANCPFRPRVLNERPFDSTSCWAEVTDSSGSKGLIELSRNTLKQLLIEIESRFSGYDVNNFQELYNTLKIAHDKSIGDYGVSYIFDQEASKDNRNTDCNFYKRIGFGSVDRETIITRFPEATCEQDTKDLARLFSDFIDQTAEYLVSPLGKIYLASYPGDVAKKITSSEINHKLFLKARLGSKFNQLFNDVQNIQNIVVPGILYETESNANLREISLKFYGSQESWLALWTINAMEIEDPYKVPPGTKIRIPIVPKPGSKWAPFPVKGMAYSEIAAKQFGSEIYAEFVKILKQDQFEITGLESDTFLLPDLGNPRDQIQISVDAIVKPEN